VRALWCLRGRVHGCAHACVRACAGVETCLRGRGVHTRALPSQALRRFARLVSTHGCPWAAAAGLA
jgi:hypothetical protein